MPCTWKTAFARPIVEIDCIGLLVCIVGASKWHHSLALSCQWKSRPLSKRGLGNYPRDLSCDEKMCSHAGVDILKIVT